MKKNRPSNLSDFQTFIVGNAAAQFQLRRVLAVLERDQSSEATRDRVKTIKADLIALEVEKNLRCQQENIRN